MATLPNLDRTFGDIIAGPKYIDNIVLAAGVAKTVTPPLGSTNCIFSATGPYFVRWNGEGAAAAPIADVLDGSGSEVNPASRSFGLATVASPKAFSIVAAADTVVSIAWFRM